MKKALLLALMSVIALGLAATQIQVVGEVFTESW